MNERVNEKVIVWELDGTHLIYEGDMINNEEGFNSFFYNKAITHHKRLTNEETEEMIFKSIAKNREDIPKNSSLGFIKKVLHDIAKEIKEVAKETTGFAPYKLLEEFQ
jgi:hypothetical protein